LVVASTSAAALQKMDLLTAELGEDDDDIGGYNAYDNDSLIDDRMQFKFDEKNRKDSLSHEFSLLTDELEKDDEPLSPSSPLPKQPSIKESFHERDNTLDRVDTEEEEDQSSSSSPNVETAVRSSKSVKKDSAKDNDGMKKEQSNKTSSPSSGTISKDKAELAGAAAKEEKESKDEKKTGSTTTKKSVAAASNKKEDASESEKSPSRPRPRKAPSTEKKEEEEEEDKDTTNNSNGDDEKKNKKKEDYKKESTINKKEVVVAKKEVSKKVKADVKADEEVKADVKESLATPGGMDEEEGDELWNKTQAIISEAEKSLGAQSNNIVVVTRVRPFNRREKDLNTVNCIEVRHLPTTELFIYIQEVLWCACLFIVKLPITHCKLYLFYFR
jgi:hypothetical protein